MNALRLLFAAAVVIGHAYYLDGFTERLPLPVDQLLLRVPVDGFFVISGFLLARSLHRDPHLGRYLLARGLRLLPGLWVCLAVTALLLAPALSQATDVSGPDPGEQLRYLLGNASTFITEHGGLGDTLVGQDEHWNGSLWTLFWELSCCLMLAAAAVTGRLRTSAVVAATCWMWAAYTAITVLGLVPYEFATNPLLAAPRLGLMFAMGALFWLYRDHVRLDGRLAGGCALVLGCSLFVQNYQVLAAPVLGYLCLYVGLVSGRHGCLVMRNDLSYGVYVYGWPVQQFLVGLGFGGSWATFSALSLLGVLPFAALSWFCVEHPAMRLRHRLARGSARGQVTATAEAAGRRRPAGAGPGTEPMQGRTVGGRR